MLDDASLKRTVDLASAGAALARGSGADAGAWAADARAVDAFVEGTADLIAETRASSRAARVDAATAAGKPAGDLFVAGFLEANARAIAVATSNGLFAYHRTTDAELFGDGAHARRHRQRLGARRRARLERDRSGAIGRIAAQKAVAQPQPAGDRAGLYTVVLEPQAVNDLSRCWRARSTRATPTKDAARSRSRAAARGSARRSSTSA